MLQVLDLLRFLNDRGRSVAGHDPACRPGYDGFILEPEESEVIDALRKIGLMMMYPGITAPGMYALSARLLL